MLSKVNQTTIEPNLSHEFQDLSRILGSTGLKERERGLTEKEIKLIELITKVYAIEADLHADEEELLAEVGLSKPNGKQKGTLQRMYNTHILNLSKLAGLTRKLKQEVADSSPPSSAKLANQSGQSEA